MSRYIQSFAEASLSVIERLTFEREAGIEEPNTTLPQVVDPSALVTSKVAPATAAKPEEKEVLALPSLEASVSKVQTVSPSASILSNGKSVLIKSLSSKDSNEHVYKGKVKKVTVVGVGSVGMAIAQTILTKAICDVLALVDVAEEKVQGEVMDLKHASAFLSHTKIVGGTDYRVTEGSDLCIVTAGQRQREGESRLSLLGRNTGLLKKIIPSLVEHSPETILLLVTNPVDILTHVAWKISGLPPHRVIGSGTNLDSSRLRSLIAEALDINAQSVHAYIIGEHGDSSVPVWSGVTIAGVPLVAFLQSKGVKLGTNELNQLHQEVVQGASDVIRLKGYTNWAIGYSVASIVQSILRNERTVHPVSTLVQGCHGIDKKVFLSLPCILGGTGIAGILDQSLTASETVQFRKSADYLLSVARELQL